MVFDKLPRRDLGIWNAMIAAYGHHKCLQDALRLFQLLPHERMKPNDATFVNMLRACSNVGALEQGKLIHGQLSQSNLDSYLNVANALIEMYIECGSLEIARETFDKLRNRDAVIWNTMITGYTKKGHGFEALHLIPLMQQQSMELSEAFVPLLRACSSVSALDEGRLLHARIMGGAEFDVNVGNALIDMHCACGNLEVARRVFEKWPNKTVVTWNSMIAGYAQHKHGQKAYDLFKQMLLEGMKPTDETFMCMLNACSSLELGKQIHDHIIDAGRELATHIGNTLIDMYAKCGSVQEARKVFDKLPDRPAVTWNAMIAAYTQNEHGKEALELFQQMRRDDMEPSDITFVNILKACASIAAWEQGRAIRDLVLESDYKTNVIVGNTLIEMYAKLGSLEDVCGVFDKLPKQSITTWNAVIAAYGQHGDLKTATQFFNDMQQEGLKPDEVTFACLLSACSRMGLVEEGCHHFKSMSIEHGVTPTIDHYNCMVDLFGQVGRLKEAEDFLETMPLDPNIALLSSLLGHCRKHGYAEIGRRCFDNYIALDPKQANPYALMASIYANAGRMEDAAKIHELRKSADVCIKPGKAFVEVAQTVHDFLMGDKSHPRIKEIYEMLEKLNVHMEKGFLPNADSMQQLVPDQDTEDILCGHSEKLAIAFGLISSSQGTTVRVSKNLRMCTGCHNATKVISKVERRDIIVTDIYRTHHFKDGLCSCKDFN